MYKVHMWCHIGADQIIANKLQYASPLKRKKSKTMKDVHDSWLSIKTGQYNNNTKKDIFHKYYGKLTIEGEEEKKQNSNLHSWQVHAAKNVFSSFICGFDSWLCTMNKNTCKNVYSFNHCTKALYKRHDSFSFLHGDVWSWVF